MCIHVKCCVWNASWITPQPSPLLIGLLQPLRSVSPPLPCSHCAAIRVEEVGRRLVVVGREGGLIKWIPVLLFDQGWWRITSRGLQKADPETKPRESTAKRWGKTGKEEEDGDEEEERGDRRRGMLEGDRKGKVCEEEEEEEEEEGDSDSNQTTPPGSVCPRPGDESDCEWRVQKTGLEWDGDRLFTVLQPRPGTHTHTHTHTHTQAQQHTVHEHTHTRWPC